MIQKKIKRKTNVSTCVDINCLWQQKSWMNPIITKLINECSYSSIDHMHIQVQYISQMFDFVTIEWGKKIREIFRNTLWYELSNKLNIVNL